MVHFYDTWQETDLPHRNRYRILPHNAGKILCPFLWGKLVSRQVSYKCTIWKYLPKNEHICIIWHTELSQLVINNFSFQALFPLSKYSAVIYCRLLLLEKYRVSMLHRFLVYHYIKGAMAENSSITLKINTASRVNIPYHNLVFVGSTPWSQIITAYHFSTQFLGI